MDNPITNLFTKIMIWENINYSISDVLLKPFIIIIKDMVILVRLLKLKIKEHLQNNPNTLKPDDWNQSEDTLCSLTQIYLLSNKSSKKTAFSGWKLKNTPPSLPFLLEDEKKKLENHL